MSEGDDRRPVWMPLAALALVAAGIVGVSIAAEKLPHRDDRVATPSIPVAETSTTTTLPSTPSTSSTIPTAGGGLVQGFVFGIDDLCEQVPAEEVAYFVEEAYGWEATAVKVAPAYQEWGCQWELRDSDGGEGEVWAGQAIWGRYDLTRHMTVDVVDFAELDEAWVPIGASVSGHPSLSDGVVVHNGGFGQFAFGVPPRDQYLQVWVSVPGDEPEDQEGWEQEERKFFTVANGFIEALGWLPTVRLVPVVTLDPLSTSIGTIEFTTWGPPQGFDLPWSITATAHGVVAISDTNETIFWSDDGVTWSEVPVSIEPTSYGFASDGNDLIVYNRFGVVRLTWDGIQWVEEEHLRIDDADSLGMNGANQLVVGPNGIVAIRDDQLFYSADGTDFHLAEQPPSPHAIQHLTDVACSPSTDGEYVVAGLRPVVATNGGFIALTPRRGAANPNMSVCGPLVWFSTDGNTWEPVSEESPFGRYAIVYDIVTRDGRLVAAGRVTGDGGAIWVSDDGLGWERADVPFAHAAKIAAGARGWIVLGETEAATSNGQMWFSTDGITWDGPYEQPYGWSYAWGIDAAVLDDRIIGRGRFVVVGEFLDDTPADKAVVLTPADWQIDLDHGGPGIHTVLMILYVHPLTVDDVEDLSGRLVWDETVVDLCTIQIRSAGDDGLRVGDIFSTNDEGCKDNPTAVQDAFDAFGLPDTACVTVRAGGIDHEYCSPLN